MRDSEQPEVEQTKRQIAAVFSRAAPTYDQVGPQFFAYYGRRLVDVAQIPNGATVLDIASGRGAVLFPAAERVGPLGRVIGIDLADAMVQATTQELARQHVTNAEVRHMDAEHLVFPDASFDYVLAGFSIFFFPQLDRALSEIRRVLKPYGHIGMTTWGPDDNRWQWLGELFNTYLPPQADVPQSSETQQLIRPDFRSRTGLEAVLRAAGFVDIQVVEEQVEFVYRSEEEWWLTQWSHGMRGRLEQIENTAGLGALDQFKADAFKEMQVVRQPDGFHHLIPALFTLASKPG